MSFSNYKVVSLSLAALMITGLAGCGSQGDQSSANSGASAPAPAAAPAPPQGAPQQADPAAVKSIRDQLFKMKPKERTAYIAAHPELLQQLNGPSGGGVPGAAVAANRVSAPAIGMMVGHMSQEKREEFFQKHPEVLKALQSGTAAGLPKQR